MSRGFHGEPRRGIPDHASLLCTFSGELDRTRTLCAAHTLDSLLADWKATAALERCIEIVGEGVRRLPNELNQRRDDIPCKEIAGTRDHLIHGYDLIDHRVLWDAVHIDIPRLIEAIDELLA